MPREWTPAFRTLLRFGAPCSSTRSLPSSFRFDRNSLPFSKGSAVKSLHRFLWSAFALSFVPSLAWADEPSLATWTERRVREALVGPLAKQEARVSPFSRGRPAPRERRVRALQTT